MKKILKPFYNFSKAIINICLDYFDNISGKKNPLVPPRNMIFIGDGNYLKIGNEFLGYFKELAGLKNNHRILDVGCGIGRMAVPLTGFLSPEGNYFGFDIVKEGIVWSKKNISSRYPNFHFEHADIYNKSYNPKGKEESSSYKFKYQNNSFDFVFLTSVFTHMQKEDICQYLSEISRVMKSGGKCLITFFIINEESLRLVREGKASQNLIYQIDDFSYVKDTEIPESAIGFTDKFLNDLFDQNELFIENIKFGSWCGRKEFTSYQDIVIAKKINN